MSDENTFKKLKKLSLARLSYSPHCRLVYVSLEPLQRERFEFSEWKKKENRAGSLVSCSSRSRSDRHVEVKTHVSTAQFDWRLDWLWSHGNTEQKRQRALSNNDDEITKQYSSAGWKLRTHTQLWGAEVLQPLFSRAPLTASAVSDGGGNRAAGRRRMEEEDGGREGVSQAGWTDSGQSHCSSMSQRFLDELPSARYSVTCDHTELQRTRLQHVYERQDRWTRTDWWQFRENDSELVSLPGLAPRWANELTADSYI